MRVSISYFSSHILFGSALACHKHAQIFSLMFVFAHNNLLWYSFFVSSTLFCCGGFIYKIRVENQVSLSFCLSLASIRWPLVLSYVLSSNTIEPNVFFPLWQRGIDALPGMTILSAFLETVSLDLQFIFPLKSMAWEHQKFDCFNTEFFDSSGQRR